MPFLPALLRHVIGALLGALLALPAIAQELPAPKITGDDIRRALIWTGHLSVMTTGDPAVIYRTAMQSWQTSKGYKATDTLADEQVAELLAEGDKQRDSFGWSKLEDKSIGFSIGVPTKLVKFLSARTDNGNFWYDFEGGVRYTVGVRYGDVSCSNVDLQLARIVSVTKPTFKVRYTDGYAIGGEGSGQTGYLRVVCRTSGVVIAGVDIATSQMGKLGVLIPAMADSLSVSRHSRGPSSNSRRRRRATSSPSPRRGLRRRSPRPTPMATARPMRSSARRATGRGSRLSRYSTRCRPRCSWSRPASAWVRRWRSASASS